MTDVTNSDFAPETPATDTAAPAPETTETTADLGTSDDVATVADIAPDATVDAGEEKAAEPAPEYPVPPVLDNAE